MQDRLLKMRDGYKLQTYTNTYIQVFNLKKHLGLLLYSQ